MKLSIIIPVYNVERFLPECIDSLMKQQDVILGKDYELIFVNDGSTDNSLQVIEDKCSSLDTIFSGGGICL